MMCKFGKHTWITKHVSPGVGDIKWCLNCKIERIFNTSFKWIKNNDKM